MPNQPIPVNQADAMIAKYVSYMKDHGINMTQQTMNVSFNTASLMTWLDDVKVFTDEFRVCVGVYPDGELKAGRITAIIWPYKDGKPATRPDEQGKSGGGSSFIKPFNEGGLTP
jgi:myosin-crossreactive antigen